MSTKWARFNSNEELDRSTLPPGWIIRQESIVSWAVYRDAAPERPVAGIVDTTMFPGGHYQGRDAVAEIMISDTAIFAIPDNERIFDTLEDALDRLVEALPPCH